MNNNFLKRKNKVSEQEFLEYLDSICQNPSIKNMVLEFYNTLKASDKKFGKTLTVKSFGKTPKNYSRFPLYTDQAKYLFLSLEDQAKDDELRNNFNQALTENEKIEDEKSRQKADDLAYQTFQTEEDKLFNQDFATIGVSDLFRFQFLNFVNTISIEDTYHIKNTRGYYNCFLKELKLFNIKKNFFADKNSLECFKLQNTINHELTHMLSMTSLNFNNNPIFTSPCTMFVLENAIGMLNPEVGELIEANRKILQAYMYAEEILNELATDYYSLYTTNRLAAFDLHSQNHENVPNCVYGAASKDNKFNDFTSYSSFGNILEIIFKNQSSFEKCIINPVIPVWGQYNIIKNFTSSAKISNGLEMQINNKISKSFNIELNLLNKINQFDKFKILIGATFCNHIKEKQSPYDLNMMLAQGMLFDIMESRLLKNLENKYYNPTSSDFNQDFLEAFLQKKINDAKYIDIWVIKPNNHTPQDKPEDYCNCKLAEISNQTPANAAWAKYLETLCKTTYQLAPDIIHKSDFLKKEFEFLNKKNNHKLNLHK